MRYKCERCFLVLKEEDLVYGFCPVCGETPAKMCPNDKDDCTCAKDIHETAVMCEICGKPMCPECGCHDVSVISRITGYLSELDGWNEGKKAEFYDRVRVSPNGSVVGNISGKYD